MKRGDRILRIRGQRWRLRFVSHLGENRGVCDKPNRIIRVESGHSTVHITDTLVHEILHAALWDLDEEAVAETATAIALALARCGLLKSDKPV